MRPMPREAVRIERLTVRDGRIACDLAVLSGAPRESTPEIAARLARRFPTLALHACVNENGDTFGACMEATPLPHVFEHLVIDLQVRADEARAAARAADVRALAAPDGAPASAYVGTSEWVDEAAGLARVEVSFTDDLVALRAFRDAAAALNKAVVP